MIVLCGYPSCGKSSAAEELNAYFVSRRLHSVHVISDANLVKDTTLTYSHPQKEKEVRNQLKSEVQKILDKDTIVILDSLNYIKGYRYELYAVSKACKTTQCTVHLNVEPDVAWKINECRIGGGKYNKDIFSSLVQRFEAPDAKNRWDRPLFTVQDKEQLPLDHISKAILQPAPPPNQATLTQPLSPTQFLYETDQVTQHIITMILKSQDERNTAEPFLIPGTTSTIALTRFVTLAELSRLRRQFISYNNCHPVEDTSKLPEMFVQFLTNRI